MPVKRRKLHYWTEDDEVVGIQKFLNLFIIFFFKIYYNFYELCLVLNGKN